MIKRCEICGREFAAKRSTAKYCSEACKKRHQRGTAVRPLAPIAPTFSMPREAVLEAVRNAHQAASDLSRASMHTSSPLCRSLARVAAELEEALRREGL